MLQCSLKIGQAQGRHGVDDLAQNAKRFAAGRQDLEFRAVLQEHVCEVRTGIQEMLAVIEDQQRRSGAQEVDQQLRMQAIGLGRDPEHGCHGLCQKSGVIERRQLYQPDAVGIFIQHLPAHFQRDACLANPARSGQGHQALRVDEPQDLCLFLFAPDEGGQGGGQVVRGAPLLCFRQFSQASLPGKFQQALHPRRLMLQMQSRDEESFERCRIGYAVVFFDPADLRIAVSDLNGQLALGELFPFAQVFEQLAKGGKLYW